MWTESLFCNQLKNLWHGLAKSFSRSSREECLCRLLVEAEEKIRKLGSGPIWSSYESGIALAEFVANARRQIESGSIDTSTKSELWGIFAPTCDWDDTVGDVKLGNEIFELVDFLYRKDVRFDKNQTPPQ